LLSDQQWISPDYREAGYAGSGVNLLAELPATVSSDRWIVVGAHYDSADTSPGADDNASGVTAVLLVAGELTALETRRVNILFAFFDQEEEGLIGSHALVREFNVNQRLVLATHIMDMIGWDQDDDRIVEVAHCGMPEASNDTMMQLYTHAARRLAWNSSGITIGGLVRTESCSSDHVFFAEDGIPAVQLGEEFSGRDMTPYYHQPQDTCATIDYIFLQSVAALVAEAVTIQME
jgi:Zn-dependent M28 family amino/carboxypeptidase